MADFDAGSIEGHLRLDTKPFYAGLRRAREQAERFERERHEAKIGLDTGEFDVKRARVSERMETLKHKVATPEVNVRGIGKTLAGLALVSAALKHLDRSVGSVARGSISVLTNRMTLMGVGAIGLLAALGPLAGAVTAFGAAGASAIVPLALGFGLFGLAVKGALADLKKANAEGKHLAGWGGTAQKNLKALSTHWDKISKSIRPQIFQIMARLLQGANHALTKMAPVIKTVADGLVGVSKEIQNVLDSRRFKQFAGILDKFMAGFTKGLGPVVRDLMYSTMTAFRELQPILSLFGTGILNAAAGLRKFTSEGGGLEKFVAKITPWLPKIGDLLGHVFQSVGKIASGLAPLAGPALAFIDALVVGIGKIDWGTIAHALTPVFQTLTAALPHVVDGINWIVKLVDKLTHAGGFSKLAIDALLLYGVLSKIAKLKFASSILGMLTGGIGGKGGGKHSAGRGGLLSLLGLGGGAGEAGKATTMLGKVGAALKTVAGRAGLAAIGGVAVVDGFKRMNTHASKLSKGLGLVETTAGAAAAGFAIGGPWGAAIGAVGGLTVSVLKSTGALHKMSVWAHKHMGDYVAPLTAAEKAAQRAQKAIDDLKGGTAVYTRALQASNGVITQNVVQLADQRLQHGRLLELSGKLGVSQRFLTQAVAGDIGKRRILARILANNTSLTNAQRNALIGEMDYMNKARIATAKKAVADAEGAVRTARGAKAVAAAREELKRAKAELERLQAATKKGIVVHMKAREALNEARALHSGIMGIFTPIVQAVRLAQVQTAYYGAHQHQLAPVNDSPHHAKGAVTTGPHRAIVGDNPGGHEAIIPLDKYDVPKKGDIERIAAGSAATSQKVVEVLAQIAAAIRGANDPEALADALDKVMGKHSDAQVRKMVQMQRSA